ncbi:uncharacterized protein FSUBG_14019 [Fusarium subglutinans]|uniref:PD-(D/E)XK nuclease-like domain-containing protein n=1 Tax=Gibberella subglutinans TaxID=42677 RepID=A0A8H5KI70_GIBSU|nr:uncharacterized protein FSUBG_14019 [Fusarium subglutinans]KAF5574725.1 hypothetical protein FSUBG_14019 [Fusarium subglutinans]
MKHIAEGQRVVLKYLEPDIGTHPMDDLDRRTDLKSSKSDNRDADSPDLHQQLKLCDVLQALAYACTYLYKKEDDSGWKNYIYTPLLNVAFIEEIQHLPQLDSFRSWNSVGIMDARRIPNSKCKKVDYICYINPEHDSQLPNAAQLVHEIHIALGDSSVNHTSFYYMLPT